MPRRLHASLCPPSEHHCVQPRGLARGRGVLGQAAAKRGDADVVRALLAGGAEARAADKDGVGALHIATHQGHAEVLRLLLESGAQPDARDNGGTTALQIATRTGNAEAVRLLTAAQSAQ